MSWLSTIVAVLTGAFIVLFTLKIFDDDDGRWM